MGPLLWGEGRGRGLVQAFHLVNPALCTMDDHAYNDHAYNDHAYNDSDFKLYFKPYLYAAYFTGNLFSQNRSKIF